MTEAEWLAATDPTPMLEFLRGKVGDRKLRLFACACCRQIWDRVTEPALRHAVEVSERFADGEVAGNLLSAASKRARRALARITATETANQQRYVEAIAAGVRELPDWDRSTVVAAQAAEITALKSVANVLFAVSSARTAMLFSQSPPPNQAELLRCIFSNPFRPVAADPSWLTSTVAALARGIYDDRAFDRLPILADALQDAGCDHPDVLTHCRGPGPHARGCWVVDLVLGKE